MFRVDQRKERQARKQKTCGASAKDSRASGRDGDRYPLELSGGQQQRVGIARALAADAKILLMDEPFGALDEITKRAMQNEMLSLQKQLHMTIVFITHDIQEAMKLGDRVLVMEKGGSHSLVHPGNTGASGR